MMAIVKKIVVDQGTSKTIEFQHYVGQVGVGNEFNLTGYSATVYVRKKDANGSVLLQFTTSTGLTIGGTNGKVTLALTPSHTSGLSFIELELDGYYNLEITNGTIKYRTFEGPFIIHKGTIH
jgi:hypothetical protein